MVLRPGLVLACLAAQAVALGVRSDRLDGAAASAAEEGMGVSASRRIVSSEGDLPLHKGRHLQKDIQLTVKADDAVADDAAAGASTTQNVNAVEVACAKGCQHHGECDFTTGTCTCHPGFHGDACDTAYACVDGCNYRGTCVSDGVCECVDGFSGDVCELDTRCPDDCNGHGACSADGTECVCDAGFEGETCDVASTPMMAERTWKKLYPPEVTMDIGSKPDRRHSCAGVVYGNRLKSHQVLIWGGVAMEETLDSMWLYDHSLRQWHRKMQGGLRPGPRYSAAVAGTDEAMYMFGGYEPCDGDDRWSSDFWSFTFKTDTWDRVPTLLDAGLVAGPVGRVGHTLTYVGGSALVMFGGMADTLPLSDTWHWTVATSKWRRLTTSSFGSRRYHAATAIMMGTTEAKMIHGGVNADGEVTDTMAYYDLAQDQWVTVAAEGSSPGARQKHSIMYKDSMVFLFGGQYGTSKMSDVWILNMGASPPVWQGQVDASGAIDGRASAVALMLQGQIVVAMGEGPEGPSDDVFSVASETQVWEKAVTIGDLPVKRMQMTATVLEDKLWVFGGESEVGAKLNDLWDMLLPESDMGHVWTEHAPTSVAAADSASSYTCGAATTASGADSGAGVVTTEEAVQWPAQRAAHAATSMTGLSSLCGDYPTLFIFGGVGSDDAARNDLWYYCEGSQQWEPVPLTSDDVPAARSMTSIVAGNGRVMVFGGMTTDKVRLNDLWQCTVSSGTCTELYSTGEKKPHTRRSMSLHLHTFGAVSEPMVFGGYWKEKNACSTCAGVVRYVDTDRTVDIWRYQEGYARWRKVYAAHAPDARYCPGSTMNDDLLFMFGGYAMDGLVEHNDFWAFDLNKGQWSRLPTGEGADCPTGRHSHEMLKYAQGLDGTDTYTLSAIVYGGIGLKGVLGDIWMADVTDVVAQSTRAKSAARAHRASRMVHTVA